MIALAIGLGVLGFVAMRRAHRRCHAYGYGGYYGGCHGGDDGNPWGGNPWGHHHHHHGRWGRGPGRWMMYGMLRRIDASPAQERAIIAEVDRLKARVRDSRANLRDVRGDLAAAVRGPSLDDAALGAVLGRVDGATNEVRGAVLEAIRNIHGLLDDRQRNLVAEMLDKSGGGFRGGFGPYRM